MSNIKPLLSIIISTHNNSKTIKRLIESFYKEIFSLIKKNEIEIVCIDDHSVDNSIKIVSEYSEISIHKLHEHGISNSRNLGINIAKGKYLWFVDADDELVGSAIDTQFINKLESYSADIFLLGAKKVNKGNTIECVNKINGIYSLNKKFDGFNKIFKDNILNCSWNKIYSTALIKKNNLKFQKIASGEDALFNCDYLDKVNTIYIINRIMYIYYINSTTSSKWSWDFKKTEASLEVAERVFSLKNNNLLINDEIASRIIIDSLIGIGINIFNKYENDLTLSVFKKEYSDSRLKHIKSCIKVNDLKKSYFLKGLIAKSPVLSYFYIKKAVLDK